MKEAFSNLEAVVYLGEMYSAKGQHENALEAYRRALALDPTNAEVAVALATSLEMSGQAESAAIFLRGLIHKMPNSALLRHKYAEILLEFGLWEPGLDQLSALEQLAPGKPETARLKAQCLISLGRTAEAEQVLNSSPRTVDNLTMLGFLRQSLGRFAEARQAFLNAIELDPARGDAYFGLGQGKNFGLEDWILIEKTARLVDSTDILPQDQIPIRYFLGKALEDLGEYGRAIEHYEKANRLAFQVNLKSRPFPSAEHERLISTLISSYENLDLSEVAPQSAGPIPLLVVGMMRSGTSLVEQILSAHPEVFGAGELEFWAENQQLALEKASLPNLGREYTELIASLSSETRYVIDKTPTNYQLLGPIRSAVPSARLIHVRRSPADTCLSIYTTAYSVSPDFAHVKESIALNYRQYQRVMDHWRKLLPVENLIEIDYETLIHDRGPVVSRILSWLGLKNRVLDHERNERMVRTPSAWQVRQPLYSSSIGRWRRFEPHIPQFVQLESS